MAKSWLYQGGIFFLLLLVRTVLGMDPGSSSAPGSELSTLWIQLGSQLIQLQKQVEVLQQKDVEKIEQGGMIIQLQKQVEVLQQKDVEKNERIAHLEQEFERRVSLLESACGSNEMGPEMSGGEEVTMSANVSSTSSDLSGEAVTMSANVSSTSSDLKSILLVGGITFEGNLTTSVQQFGSNDCTELSLPVPRYGHVSGLTHDGVMLVCGGYDGRGWFEGKPNDCIYFNKETRTWEFHSYLPESERGTDSSIVFTEIGTYILGGLNGYGNSSSYASLFLPIGSNTWTVGPEIPGDGVFRSCALSLNSTHIMVIGGGDDPRQIRLLDITTNTWTQWPDLPYAVFFHACIMTEEGIMVTGGYDTETKTLNDQTLIIDPHTGQVDTVGPLLTPRAGHVMLMVEDGVMVVGGHSDSDPYSTEQYNGQSWEIGEIVLDTERISFDTIIIPNTITCNQL